MINRKKQFADFERKIGYKFKNKELLLKALTHSSFAKSDYSGSFIEDNERLEFLGDAILQAAVSDFLVRRFPQYNEGELSKARASMVNRNTLAMLGREVGIGPKLLVGKSLKKQGGHQASSLIADALEALIGAIYLDSGYKKAKCFVRVRFAPLWEDVENNSLSRDYKSLVQEFLQKHLGAMPKYEVIGEFGNSHERHFEVELTFKSTCTRGVGKNKKSAEQDAARKALNLLNPEEHSE